MEGAAESTPLSAPLARARCNGVAKPLRSYSQQTGCLEAFRFPRSIARFVSDFSPSLDSRPDRRGHENGAIAQKADILTLARIAGHSDPNVTLRIYGHLMAGALSEAADLYDPLRDASSG
jgi:hypothetical protein